MSLAGQVGGCPSGRPPLIMEIDMDIVKKWHVVVDKYCTDPEPEDHVWTVSRDPNETGWTTDSGCNGYGLPKADAEELANSANEIERLREALKKIADMSDEWSIHAVVQFGIIARSALKGDD